MFAFYTCNNLTPRQIFVWEIDHIGLLRSWAHISDQHLPIICILLPKQNELKLLL